MTAEEFSNEFDLLYNNINSNQAPGLTEYEKSVFLTKAQDQIVKSYFDPRLNKPQEGYDSVERRQIDFSMITVNAKYTNRNTGHTEKEAMPALDLGDIQPLGDFVSPIFDTRAETVAVKIPTDVLMLINEYIKVARSNGEEKTSTRLTVIPITYDEYDRLMSKPYKRPLKWQAWRLINTVDGTRLAEFIVGPGDTVTEYNVRYIKKPRPIIIGPLDGLSIDGEPNIIDIDNPCELDPILHPEILQRGVELASAVYKGDLSTQLALGMQSQTNIGMVTQSNG